MDLPEEVLADILRRVVPPRHLAECRRVCGYWRSTIDGRRLVLSHLLPSAPRGAFINFLADGWGDTYFFARGGGGGVDARLADARSRWCTAFMDHRNGLLLCEATEGSRFIYNLATRRAATLLALPRAEPPTSLRPRTSCSIQPWSLHHEVFLLPEPSSEPEPAEPDDPPPPPFNVARLFFKTDGESSQSRLLDSEEDVGEDWLYTENDQRWHTRASHRRGYLKAMETKGTLGLMEWPPSLYVVPTVTGRWEERASVREGGAHGAVADMWSDPPPNYGGVVPLLAAISLCPLRRHCRGGFIIK
ncbi:unnamed protein product [Alopecurus aequalis]